MRKIIVAPLESVNGIRFGAQREIVRNAFGSFEEFKKSPFSKNTSDDFGDFHIFYDSNNCFEAVEIFEAEVKINNTVIFPGTLAEANKLIADLKSNDPDYWISKEQSVGLCAPDGEIESILFGIKKYYGE
ncbi:MAG: hypothetical protein NC299_18485 [Lachnospiraceae bacterium]|nr:hypothetical protein [Lachnospiraceae bacterium]